MNLGPNMMRLNEVTFLDCAKLNNNNYECSSVCATRRQCVSICITAEMLKVERGGRWEL